MFVIELMFFKRKEQNKKGVNPKAYSNKERQKQKMSLRLYHAFSKPTPTTYAYIACI
jgi:hypothetical protein